jgi:hypothetical protein
VQVQPVQFMLKAHETNRLTLNCDEVLSSFAFNFNLRRYSKDLHLVRRCKLKPVL